MMLHVYKSCLGSEFDFIFVVSALGVHALSRTKSDVVSDAAALTLVISASKAPERSSHRFHTLSCVQQRKCTLVLVLKFW